VSDTATIEAIREAAAQRISAVAAHKATVERLSELCQQAHAEGVSMAQIAREAGLSRQGLYALVAAHPHRPPGQ
jgi:DNA-binding phage protein